MKQLRGHFARLARKADAAAEDLHLSVELLHWFALVRLEYRW